MERLQSYFRQKCSGMGQIWGSLFYLGELGTALIASLIPSLIHLFDCNLGQKMAQYKQTRDS